jgi:hypothetical protein
MPGAALHGSGDEHVGLGSFALVELIGANYAVCFGRTASIYLIFYHVGEVIFLEVSGRFI